MKVGRSDLLHPNRAIIRGTVSLWEMLEYQQIVAFECASNNWPIWTHKVPKKAWRCELPTSTRVFSKIFFCIQTVGCQNPLNLLKYHLDQFIGWLAHFVPINCGNVFQKLPMIKPQTFRIARSLPKKSRLFNELFDILLYKRKFSQMDKVLCFMSSINS